MFTDPEVLDIFINIQKVLKPDISVEVGAYDADFSKKAKSFDIDIFAFEASPYVFNKFKDEMHGIFYINKAISNKNEFIQFEIDKRYDPSEVGHNGIKNRNLDLDYEYIKVPCVSIDEYFKNIPFSLMYFDC
jgi:hypothetical protein